MEFQIKDKNGRGMYYTTHESCVPVEKLDSMNAAGLVFYIDGKKNSLSAVKTRFKNIKRVKILKYTGSPVFDDEVTEVTKVAEKKSTKPKSLIPEKKSISKIDLDHLDFPITSRCVVCLTTGKVYKNQTEAAKDLKIDPSYISDCVCKGKEYKGYKFQRVVDLK